MIIQPLYDRVVILRTARTTTTAGGIIIPEAATERPETGTVLAVGPGKDKPLTVKVGDEVVFPKYGGNTIKSPDGELLVLREDEIYGIVK
jgi:chaperonin GroES